MLHFNSSPRESKECCCGGGNSSSFRITIVPEFESCFGRFHLSSSLGRVNFLLSSQPPPRNEIPFCVVQPFLISFVCLLLLHNNDRCTTAMMMMMMQRALSVKLTRFIIKTNVYSWLSAPLLPQTKCRLQCRPPPPLLLPLLRQVIAFSREQT